MTRRRGEDGQMLPYELICPCCEAAAIIRSSEQLTPVYGRKYIHCLNDGCESKKHGRRGIVMHQEHVAINSPSRRPNPEISLPPTPEFAALVEGLFGQLPEAAQSIIFPPSDLFRSANESLYFICPYHDCDVVTLMRNEFALSASAGRRRELGTKPPRSLDMRELTGDLFEQLSEIAS